MDRENLFILLMHISAAAAALLGLAARLPSPFPAIRELRWEAREAGE